MKNLSFALIATSIIFTLASCNKDCRSVNGSGRIVTFNRDLTNFTGVDYQLSGKVNITRDSVYNLTITTHDNYQDLIQTSIIGGNLVIDALKSLKDDDITINIHMPDAEFINLSGSGSIYTTNNFNSNNLVIKLSGSGNIDYSGVVNAMKSNISGSGNIMLYGSCINQTFNISGSGNIKAYTMQCVDVAATISGSGNIETSVSDNLHANISGSGDIKYHGNPAVTVNISGSGNVIHEQ